MGERLLILICVFVSKIESQYHKLSITYVNMPIIICSEQNASLDRAQSKITKQEKSTDWNYWLSGNHQTASTGGPSCPSFQHKSFGNKTCIS